MNTLIVGGTSGLGLNLAKRLAKSDSVWIVGRTDPEISEISFARIDLTDQTYSAAIQKLVESTDFPNIDRLIYSSGFFQDGLITDLSAQQVGEMMNVVFGGAIAFVKTLLEKHGGLSEFVAVTSTSQWTPRQREPIYTAAKAALAMFANSMAEDGRVGKVLVAGPAGMKTKFWEGVSRDDIDQMLDPDWVAEQIISNLQEQFRFREIRILRQPPRVEIQSQR